MINNMKKKRPFTESRNSCNVVSNNSSDTSIEEMSDSDEDEDIKRKKNSFHMNENKMNNEVSIERNRTCLLCSKKIF